MVRIVILRTPTIEVLGIATHAQFIICGYTFFTQKAVSLSRKFLVMKNLLLVLCVLGLVGLILWNVRRTRTAAAVLSGEPNPMRVAVLQYQAIAEALAAVEASGASPELKAARRQVLMEKKLQLSKSSGSTY